MSDSDSHLEVVARLGDEFIDRCRAGASPTIDEYVERYPDYAEQIQELFPALIMLEDLAPNSPESIGAETIEEDSKGQGVRQIGDFRIIREVGRGGMGIVYEAEQESLRRHVALKVLPSNMLPDTKQQRRFEREARSAARLHHTNIVPVFGVGHEQGMHYYVMQFIQGLGLDDVLNELRRLKLNSNSGEVAPGELRVTRRTETATPGGSERRTTGASQATEARSTTSPLPDRTAAEMAHSLMAGRFEIADTLDCGEVQPASDDAKSGHDRVHEVDRTLASDLGHVEDSVSCRLSNGSVDARSDLSDSFTLSSSSVQLPGSGDSSETGGRPQSYWVSVANIGAQVASALQHAHEQGVTHRDIKPANLLLDLRGCVWVTDFGLAKADDQQNLTHTGDILGTLRYMPPEAFEGRTDHLGDIYSLGLTLYELLALQPAFCESDRNRLIKRVTDADATPLDQANSEIPRDLVTIVHKAIDREPGRRYQSGQEFADDLNRFLRDEPIRARRVSLLERWGRWAKRNRGLAASISTVAALILLIAVGASIAAARFRSIGNELYVAGLKSKAQADAYRDLANKETAARKESDKNFQRSVEVVESYLDKVTEEELLRVPGMQSLRRDLLHSALDYYKDFARERSDQPELREKLAAALTRIGRITTELGSLNEAAEHHRRAGALLNELRASGDNLQLQLLAVQHHESLGQLLLKSSEPNDAIIQFEKANSILEPIVAVNSGLQVKRARILNALSEAFVSIGKVSDAFDCRQDVLALMEDRSEPGLGAGTSDALVFEIAKAMRHFAELHELLGYDAVRQNRVGLDDRGIDELFGNAEELLQSLLESESGSVTTNQLLGEIAKNRLGTARFYQRAEQQDRVLQSYELAVEIQQRLCDQNPAVPEYRVELSRTKAQLARLSQSAGQLETAVTMATEAVSLVESAATTDDARRTLADHLFY